MTYKIGNNVLTNKSNKLLCHENSILILSKYILYWMMVYLNR